MTLIDKVLETEAASNVWSAEEALVALLVGAAQADSRITRDEATRFNQIVRSMRLFRELPGEGVTALVNKMVSAVVAHAPAETITRAAASLPSQWRETAFTLATDLVLADGKATEQEKAFIDGLQRALKIDDAFALKVVEVMLIKNAGQ